MKFTINLKEKTRKTGKKESKTLPELILFVFTMCVLVAILIFGAVENKDSGKQNEEAEPVFGDGILYDVLDLGLLEN